MSRFSSVLRRLVAPGSAALLLLPATAAAQVEFTPFAASYYQITHLTSGTSGAGNDFTFDQANAFALGARIGFPIGGQLGLQGEFVYSFSGVRLTEEDVFGPGLDGGIAADGNIIFGSVRAVYTPRRSNLFLLAGPAIIRRGGDAWDGIDGSDLTDFGGVVGFGIRANVTPRFRLNFTAESYLYSFDGGGPDSEFQADVLVSVGVPISFSR